MPSTHLANTAAAYLQHLCTEIDNRCVGSSGNRQATDFFSEKMVAFGFQTECPQFDCIDWTHGEVSLTVGGKPFAAFVSPYSLACDVSAPLAVISSLAELEKSQVSSSVLLLQGEMTKEQLMPKNFTFYNPEHHQRIIHLLETKQPVAIIAATSRDPELAGGIYPFPLIEDGDFDIPSIYLTEDTGHRLAEHEQELVSIKFDAARLPSTGCNVVARKGSDPANKVVLFAHIDAKIGTPGALDNATGVSVLLLVAELLQDYADRLTIEIVALNGEDYYSAPGEVLYLASNHEQLADVYLGINLDGAGYTQGKTAYSLYECPPHITSSIHTAFSSQKEFLEGEPWYQSDHSLFIMNKRPALAITSKEFLHLSTYITHTAEDTPKLVEPSKLVEIALALRDLLHDLTLQSA
jgi:aminopeptidase YwaD